MAMTPQPGSRRSRSIELAHEHGYDADAHIEQVLTGLHSDAARALVSMTLRIPSARTTAIYLVTYDADSDAAICKCLAAQFGRACWHAGLAMLCGRAAAQVYSPTWHYEAEPSVRVTLSPEASVDEAEAAGVAGSAGSGGQAIYAAK